MVPSRRAGRGKLFGSRVMVHRVFLRCALAIAGPVLFASAAAASPLFAAVEQPAAAKARAPLNKHAFQKPGRLLTERAAALESVQLALSRVEDRSMYVWHRGRLSGTVKPTSSFRRTNGELCRHLVIELATDEDFRTMEGVACREANGLWRLEG